VEALPVNPFSLLSAESEGKEKVRAPRKSALVLSATAGLVVVPLKTFSQLQLVLVSLSLSLSLSPPSLLSPLSPLSSLDPGRVCG
jgi:hypothetical protein